MISVTNRIDFRLSVCPSVRPYERKDLSNYKTYNLQLFFVGFVHFLDRSSFLFFVDISSRFKVIGVYVDQGRFFFSIFGLKFSWMLGNTYCKSIKLGIYVILSSSKNFWSIFFWCHAHPRPYWKSSITSVFVGIFRLKFSRTLVWCSSMRPQSFIKIEQFGNKLC